MSHAEPQSFRAGADMGLRVPRQFKDQEGDKGLAFALQAASRLLQAESQLPVWVLLQGDHPSSLLFGQCPMSNPATAL